MNSGRCSHTYASSNRSARPSCEGPPSATEATTTSTTSASPSRRRPQALKKLEPLSDRFGGEATWNIAVGGGSDDLLEALRRLYLQTLESSITWVIASQAAKAARDQELLTLAIEYQAETETQGKVVHDKDQDGHTPGTVFG